MNHALAMCCISSPLRESGSTRRGDESSLPCSLHPLLEVGWRRPRVRVLVVCEWRLDDADGRLACCWLKEVGIDASSLLLQGAASTAL